MTKTDVTDSHPIFSNSLAPLYSQLADVLRERIRKGEWIKGDIVPPLEYFMKTYSVSRVTVRQAIKLLSDDGLLSARRGKGTIVTAIPVDERPLKVETSLADLVHVYRDDKPRLEMLADGWQMPNASPEDGELAAEYFMMRRVHKRHDIKYCVITIYIEKSIFMKAEKQFKKELVLPILNNLPDINLTTGKQTLTVSKCDLETAQLLSIPIGDPVAEVRRILCNNKNTISYLADVTYRGDYIHLEMDLKP